MTRGRYDISLAAAALLWLAGVLLAGCAAERQVVTPGTGLTADMLRADGVAVVGVTVLDEVEQVRPPLVEALEGALQGARPDIAVMSAGRVRDLLGLAAYRRILFGYQQNGSLAERDRAELASALRNAARYLILARVEKDAIHVRGRGAFSTSSRTGTFGSIGVGMTSRNAKVRVMLYDLTTGHDIQSAVYASSSDNAVVPDSVWRLPRSPILPRPGDQPAPHYEPAPETPALVDALLEAFRAFARDLPGPVLPPIETPDSSATLTPPAQHSR